MSLIAFGGPGVQNAIIHLSNLFPSWKASATAVITGSFQLSFVVFFVFDQLWVFRDWSYQSLFLSYCLICLVNVVISLTMWPDVPYHIDDSVANEIEDEEKAVQFSSLLDKMHYFMNRRITTFSD